jgi:hypothetical protein
MHRWLAVLLVIALAAPAAAAAQEDPFGPLPPAQPSPAPTAPPQDEDDSFSTTGRDTLYVIAGGLLVAFVAIGVWISRDARRFTPRGSDKAALREEGPHRHGRQAKAKARAKTRAQRAARRRNR